MNFDSVLLFACFSRMRWDQIVLLQRILDFQRLNFMNFSPSVFSLKLCIMLMLILVLTLGFGRSTENQAQKNPFHRYAISIYTSTYSLINGFETSICIEKWKPNRVRTFGMDGVVNKYFWTFFCDQCRYDASDGSWDSEWRSFEVEGIRRSRCTTQLWRASCSNRPIGFAHFFIHCILLSNGKTPLRSPYQNSNLTQYILHFWSLAWLFKANGELTH